MIWLRVQMAANQRICCFGSTSQMKKSTGVLTIAFSLLEKTMTKNTFSRWFNRRTGGEDELFCYRLYIKARENGGLWLVLEWLVNLGFLLFSKEKNHVTTNYYWQRGVYREAHQKEGVTQAQKGSAGHD